MPFKEPSLEQPKSSAQEATERVEQGLSPESPEPTPKQEQSPQEGAGPEQQEVKTKEKGPDKSYYEKTTVNGVEISVGWDEDYGDYTIYFPQIRLEEASEKGVSDQVIMITRRPEVAKQIFDHASELAQTESDVYKIYKQVEDFTRGLSDDEE